MATVQLDKILSQNFGHSGFRGRQREIIEQLLAGQNALVVMPTGQGKSLCYQLPALVFEGLTLVISPLIALMKDQVDGLKKTGIAAVAIHSGLETEERKKAYEKLAAQEIKILYVTPERFRKSEFLSALEKNKISLLAIDEAHCISQWGHDFRPDYSRLAEIRKRLGEPLTLALTATATPTVQDDILKQSGLEPTTVRYLEGVERPNLYVAAEEVVGLEEKVRLFFALRHQFPGPAIVYFSLISTLEKFSDLLQKLNIEHLTYHGQLEDKWRKRNQENFLKNETGLMLATPAFGLGVDKPDVRMIVHAELPGSIEAYYQEVGRAGRDNLNSHCFLLYDEDDISIQMDFIKWANPDPGFIQALVQLIKRQEDKVRAEGLDYLRQQLNFYNSRDFRLETALNLLERWECIDWPNKNIRQIRFLTEAPMEEMNTEWHKLKMNMQNKKLLELVEWIKSTDCRKQRIYQYFGLKTPGPCGFCQNCGAIK